jgi:predicted transposase/invertase (TIGR01784 family)
MAYQIPSKQHDEYFRETLSQTPAAVAFFKAFLPAELVQNLDLAQLKLENTAFTDEILAEHFADVVYACPYRSGSQVVYLTLLIEHKAGSVDFPIPQLMRYYGTRLEAQRKQRQPLSPVIPILFVQGPKRFEMKPVAQYFPGVDATLTAFLPQIKLHIVNLPDTPDETVLNVEDQVLGVGLYVMKHIWEEKVIFRSANDVFKRLVTANYERASNYLKSTFLYLFTNSEATKQEKQAVINAVPDPIKNIAMNTLEMIYREGVDEGMEKGMEKGIEQGIEKSQKDSIRKLLMRGVEPAQVAYLLDLPIDLVNEVLADMQKP